MNETWEAELSIEASLKGFLEDLMADEWWGPGFGSERPSGAIGPTLDLPRFRGEFRAWVFRQGLVV